MYIGQSNIQSPDTVFHIAETLKSLRNKKAQNIEKITYKTPGINYEEYFAIFTISSEKNYYIQISTEDANTMYAEISSTHPDNYKLAKYKYSELKAIGWKEPQGYAYVNYWKFFDVTDENACYITATELVIAMIKAFEYRTTEPIKIEMSNWEGEITKDRVGYLLDKIKNITKNILSLIINKLNT